MEQQELVTPEIFGDDKLCKENHESWADSIENAEYLLKVAAEEIKKELGIIVYPLDHED